MDEVVEADPDADAEADQEERWARLLPELLSDVVRRVEASGGERWPARKDVVSCACVCRRWREAAVAVVRPPAESGKITFSSSFKQVAMTAAAAAAGVHPKWVLLEPYVFRGDDDKSFPDDTVAPIKASGTTSWGARFRIAFSLAEPPSISRLYAQLPGFPDPRLEDPLRMVPTHCHLALLKITTSTPSEPILQNLFIFKANQNNPSSSSLTALPLCTERQYDFRGDLSRHRSPNNAPPRPLHSRSSGLWCGDNGEEFVVAELTLCVPTKGRIRTKALADIRLLRSSFTDDQLGRRKWNTTRVHIPTTTDDDLWKLSHWQTDAAIPFQQWLCWIDYHQGILFCDVSKKVPTPTISFFWFPPDEYSLNSPIRTLCSSNGGVSVVDHGNLLKFVYVARHDSGPAFGVLKPGTRFTITCHTLVLGSSMEWKLDYTVTSDDLRDYLQQGEGLPMFPRVDIDKPHIVHFIFIHCGRYGKMSVLSIDMNKKIVVSCNLYVDRNEPDPNVDPNFFATKCLSPTPTPFLPCEFPRFCNLSRKRKDIE